MLRFPILYFKGMRLMMFQLFGFCCRGSVFRLQGLVFRLRGLGVAGFRFQGVGFREDLGV